MRSAVATIEELSFRAFPAETEVTHNGWKLRFGQFKAPFMREELVSSSRQQTAERSLVNEEFNQDRSQGVELSLEQDQMRFMVMYVVPEM